MPNYLARVAAAGMRTTIPAKPPVAGPPILPGHSPPNFAVATGIEQGEGQGIQPEINEEQVVPALPAATLALNKPVSPSTPESMQLEDQAPSTIDATPVIQAPRTLRPAYKARPDSPQLHQVEAIRSGGSTSPMSSTGTTMSSSIMPSPVAPRIKEPTDKGPVIPGVSLPRAMLESSDTLPVAAVKQISQVNQVTQPTALQSADKVRLEREHGILPTQAALKQTATPPMPPAQASAPLMPPANNPTSRQVKLTIGQLDVQVNNRQPAHPARPSTPTISSEATDTLEQRYLDRFRLKP